MSIVVKSNLKRYIETFHGHYKQYLRMKKNIYLLLLTLFVQQGCAERVETSTTTSEGITQQEVTAAMEALRQNLLSPKRESLLELAAPSLSYGHSSGMMENRDSFIASLSSGRFKFEQLNFSEIAIELSDRAAIVRHILTGRSADQGKAPADVNLHVLLVWYKQDGEVRLLARQAVKR
jgi:hypothetical protein